MIVSSTATRDLHDQVGGRFWVTETHVVSDGTEHTFSYIADPGTDVQAVLNDRAAALEEELNLVPQAITSLQARRAIEMSGLREQAEAAVAAADVDTQTLWYTAGTIERTHPSLMMLGAAIGLSGSQVDDLFRLGVTL